MTQKSIERLFPCDTSMVVVIDDRADVWQYSPNLVKVHPCKCRGHALPVVEYHVECQLGPAWLITNLSFDTVTIDEYFVGAGDINAGHLPKQDAVVKSEPAPPTNVDSTAEPAAETATLKSDLSNTSDPAAESSTDAEISTSTLAPSDPSAVPADATATETSEEKQPKEKKADETEPTPNTVGKPGKAIKSKAPVMDDNDNELKHILEVKPCCLFEFMASSFS